MEKLEKCPGCFGYGYHPACPEAGFYDDLSCSRCHGLGIVSASEAEAIRKESQEFIQNAIIKSQVNKTPDWPKA